MAVFVLKQSDRHCRVSLRRRTPSKYQLHNSVQGETSNREDHKEHINTHRLQNVEIPNVTEYGTHLSRGFNRLTRTLNVSHFPKYRFRMVTLLLHIRKDQGSHPVVGYSDLIFCGYLQSLHVFPE